MTTKSTTVGVPLNDFELALLDRLCEREGRISRAAMFRRLLQQARQIELPLTPSPAPPPEQPPPRPVRARARGGKEAGR